MDKPIAKFEYAFGALSNTHDWAPISKVFWVNLTNNHVNLYFKELGNTTLKQMEGLAYLCTQLRQTRKVENKIIIALKFSDHLDNCKILLQIVLLKEIVFKPNCWKSSNLILVWIHGPLISQNVVQRWNLKLAIPLQKSNMTSKKHLSTLQERQKESEICIHEGGSGKTNIANERQTRKMQDKDMVEVCRYKVCWLGKKERKSPM